MLIKQCFMLLVFLEGCKSIYNWNYYGKTGPINWTQMYASCGVGDQSPIDISATQVQYSSALTAFELTGYDSIPPHAHWVIENDGCVLGVNLEGGLYEISEGDLLGRYRSARFVLRWGYNNTMGSEHSIDGAFSPAELQVIHYNRKFGSLKKASEHPNGLAIFSFLFIVTNLDNAAYKHLIDNTNKIHYPDSKSDIRPIPLLSLLPSNLNNYYRYSGSLTTPPCHQSVIWSVFKDKIPISKRQLRELRHSLSRNLPPDEQSNIAGNARPVQAVNGRIVYSSDLQDSTVLTSPLTSPVAVTFAAFLATVIIIFVFRR